MKTAPQRPFYNAKQTAAPDHPESAMFSAHDNYRQYTADQV
jgi:hypothetical protein